VGLKHKNLSANERKSVIIETVIELAAIMNPGDITTAAIAKHMNLTQGALFRHYSNKLAVWQAVIEWVEEHLLERIDKAATSTESPIAALEAIFMAHIEFVAIYPGVPRILFGELQQAEDIAPKRIVRLLLQKYAERLTELIEKGKLLLEVRQDLDVTAARTLFIGSIQGLIMQSLLAGDTRYMQEKALGVFAIYRHGVENK
jgi:AcrR family transcriptional regulator